QVSGRRAQSAGRRDGLARRARTQSGGGAMTLTADAFVHLQRNMLVFGRTLRALGFRAQPDRMVLLAEALACTGIEHRLDVKAAARAVLVRNNEELGRFEIAFDEFWRANTALTRSL